MSFRSRIKDFTLVVLLLLPHVAATFVALSFLFSFSLYTLMAAVIIALTNVCVLAMLFEAIKLTHNNVSNFAVNTP